MWLIVPYSESESVPERSASSLDSTSQSPGTEQSVWWNGKARAPGEWRRVLKKDRSLHLLNGMTLPPLTAARGVEQFIYSLQASLASRSALPESAQELMMPGGSGPTSPELWKSAGPIASSLKTSQGCYSIPIGILIDGSWKSPQKTLLGEWEPYSGTWPASGTQQNGEVFERPMLERPTDAGGFLSSEWRTPDAPGSGGPRNRQSSIGQGHQTTIGEQAEHWNTPDRSNACGARKPDEKRSLGLNTEADQWQTPATDSFRSRGGDRKDEQGLDQQSRMWASPQARDHRSGETISDYGNMRPLNEQVVNWATPKTARGGYTRDHGNPEAQRESLSGQSESFQSSHQDPEAPNGQNCWCGFPGCDRLTHKRKLNPIFETWLMGWPLWWLMSVPGPCGPSEMEWYLYKQRMRLSVLLGESSGERP